MPEPASLDRALDLVRFLRANCDWDAAQTPRSLVRHLLEESHEVVDAIHDGDDALLEGELGDLLLNLAFQLVIAEEDKRFSTSDVVVGLEQKMRRRHPHLYGDGKRESWEAIKAREARDRDVAASVLDGIPRGLDAAHKAHRLQERAAGVGFDWPSVDGALDKTVEELAEVREALSTGDPDRITAELGDLLFSVMNVARLAGAHGADALERTNREFDRRFRFMERVSAARGRALEEMDLEALEALWREAKDSDSVG